MGLTLVYPAQIKEEVQLLPLFDTESVRKVEVHALELAQHTDNTLMQRAGFALFRLVCVKYPHHRCIWVVAGAGNNGGDAIAAASFLHQAGYHVRVTWLGMPEISSDAAAMAYTRAKEVGVVFAELDESTIPVCDLVIDGLLGIGIAPERELGDELCGLIHKINACGAPVLSVDVPSGLISDTGTVLTLCVKADVTLTFLTLKPGLLTNSGLQYAGEIWLNTLVQPFSKDGKSVLEIMADPPQVCAHLFVGSKQMNERAENTHKGSFGDVVVVGGSAGMLGAAILASRAALVSGAGRVYTCILDKKQDYIGFDANFPELMFRSIVEVEQSFDLAKTVVACGCGGGHDIANVLSHLLEKAPRLILDADALNAIAENGGFQELLLNRATLKMTTIITPHPLEAARLLDISAQEVQADRLAAAQDLAERFKIVCVLKGSGSVTSAPGCVPLINSSGNASLATAGTGDVLTGHLAACWCGALDVMNDSDLQKLTAQSVWQHGYAATRWQQAGNFSAIPASRLIEWLNL